MSLAIWQFEAIFRLFRKKRSIMDTKLPRTKLSVYLYIPNIIGGLDLYYIFPHWSIACFLFARKKLYINSQERISQERVIMYFHLVLLILLPFEWIISAYLERAGYIRIIMNCLAFAVCFSNKKLFSILYLIRSESIFWPFLCVEYYMLCYLWN